MPEDSTEYASGLITPEDMHKAIGLSGYLLEGRVGRVLQEHGFLVNLNGVKVDPNDNSKIIEIDVWGFYPDWINEKNRDVAVATISVECKNNSQPIAFFVQPPQVPEVGLGSVYYRGFPFFSMNPDTNVQERLGDLLGMKEWHHYCQAQEVATQFCSFTRDGKKWKIDAMSNYSKSFSNVALMAALDSKDTFNLDQQTIEVQLAYPVVVFQGPIYRVSDASGNVVVEEVTHLQLQHFATCEGRTIEAQIDVVTESALPSLVKLILNEFQVFRDRINPLYPRLLASAIDQKRIARDNAGRKMFKQHMGGYHRSLYEW